MDALRDFGRHGMLDRQVLIGRVDRLEDWPRIAPSGIRFAFLLAADGEAPPRESCEWLAADLIERGCVYFCAWGSGSQIAETSFDCALVEGDMAAGRSDADATLIWTTSHANEPLEETIFFFVNLTRPDESLDVGADTAIVLVCGSPSLFERLIDIIVGERYQV